MGESVREIWTSLFLQSVFFFLSTSVSSSTPHLKQVPERGGAKTVCKDCSSTYGESTPYQEISDHFRRMYAFPPLSLASPKMSLLISNDGYFLLFFSKFQNRKGARGLDFGCWRGPPGIFNLSDWENEHGTRLT